MMMDARLEAYRSNNSADFNECLDKTRTAVLQPMACGPNWERCLDFTGKFINTLNGEPILTPEFFKLAEQIELGATDTDANAAFKKGLDNYKNRAEAALNSCRNIADEVWRQFRDMMAMIEIGQAQQRKIEEVKGTCIKTMSECYDKTSGQLAEFTGAGVKDEDDKSTISTTTGALAVRATKSMCADKIAGCASLYCPPSVECETCQWGQDGRISNAAKCGAQTLIAFVDTVDDTKISLACKKDLNEFMQKNCAPQGAKKELPKCQPPKDSDRKECDWAELQAHEAQFGFEELKQAYPWECRNRPLRGKGSVFEMLYNQAMISCVDPTKGDGGELDAVAIAAVREIMTDVERQMGTVMQRACQDASKGAGIWIPSWDAGPVNVESNWVTAVFGGQEAYLRTVPAHNDGSEAIRITFGDVSNAATKVEPKPGLAVKMEHKGILDYDPSHAQGDGEALGWGVCIMATEKMLCENINLVVNGLPGFNGVVATYDEASRVCSYAPEYSKAICTAVLLGGTWDAASNKCSFIPQ